MLEKIEEMRKKSYGERQRFTLFVSFGLTAIIAFVWGTVVLPRTISMNKEKDSLEASIATPFSSLTQDANVVWKDIKANIDKLGGAINEFQGERDKESTLKDGSVEEPTTRGEDFSGNEDVASPEVYQGNSFDTSQDGANGSSGINTEQKTQNTNESSSDSTASSAEITSPQTEALEESSSKTEEQNSF